MKYIVRNINTGEVEAVEIGTSWFPGDMIDSHRKVVQQVTTDWFNERLWSLIEEEFFDFQGDNGIEDGGLTPELETQLQKAVEDLQDAMARCLVFQLGKEA